MDPKQHDGPFNLQAASVFLNGKLYDGIGCFCQYTYDPVAHHWTVPPAAAGALYAVTGQIAWKPTAGGRRLLRLTQDGWVVAGSELIGVNDPTGPNQQHQVNITLAIPAAGCALRLEAYQSGSGSVACVGDGIAAPQLMLMYLGDLT